MGEIGESMFTLSSWKQNFIFIATSFISKVNDEENNTAFILFKLDLRQLI